MESVDSKARYPGARVHFDIDHRADGDVAVNVVLREGTRVSPRQRRFGDLVGARARETKIETAGPDTESVRGGVAHPMRVAEAWAEHMTEGQLDDAVRLYSPTATYHAGGDVEIGPDRIRKRLAVSPVFGRGVEPEAIAGEDDAIRVSWVAMEPGGDPVESHLIVQHGEIVEQWVGEVRTVDDASSEVGPVELSVEGDVSVDERAYALDKLTRAAVSQREPVRSVVIRLEWMAHPARDQRARARVTVDIDGDPVRAHVSASTMAEAIDLLEARLATRLRHRANHRLALRRRGASSGPGEWRHGDAPGARGIPPGRARDERAIVRRPTWSAEPCTFDEAVFDLEVLDLGFLLFTDLASGQDAVVFRREDGTYAVRLAAVAERGQRTASRAAVEFDPAPTPRISLDEAQEHLDEGGEPWVFFVDPASGRGHVLYRRDDGHDGLITPRTDAGTPVGS
ncbi:MAG: sigma 54 modulation/S30EA ribosomal C-terminal domain-containing protein [Acidimicrobiales bacterium]|nr:sigma 54 modulation/S30EA ribosomal C-terminal domain-containing protein [Acidimicrobiales bacterium]